MMRINAIYPENGSVSLEQSRREWEEQRQWLALERHAALMQAMYETPSYQIQFSAMLSGDKVIVIDRVIHVPESQAYKWIFFNNVVNESNVQFAINHAIRKVHRFIDNYKV
jgi:hypothetical protein